MKKLFSFLLIAIMALCFTSCERNELKLRKKTIYLNILSNEWKYSQADRQFYAHFSMPEITSEVYNYGDVTISREYFSNTPAMYQVGLPQSVYKSETVDSTTVYYQQLIDYRVGIGYVEIQVTNSDFYYEGYTPEAMDFHVQLTY